MPGRWGRVPLRLAAARRRVLLEPSAVGAWAATGHSPARRLARALLGVLHRVRPARAWLYRGEPARALAALGPVAATGSPADRRDRARAAWALGARGSALPGLREDDRVRRALAERLAADSRPVPPRPAAPGRPRPVVPRPATRPRVLHLVVNSLPHSSAGYALRTQAVLRAQQAHGLHAEAVTGFMYPWTVLRDCAGDETVDGVRYHRLLPSARPRDDAAREADRRRLLDRLVRELRPDVLHAHSPFQVGLDALEVAAEHDLPVVYEVRGLLHETWAQRIGPDAVATERYRLEQQQEAAVVTGADAVVTLGRAMAAHLVGLGARTTPTVVANAVDASLLTDRPDVARARRQVGLEPAGLVVGSVSSLVAYEGFDVLLRAAAELAGRGTAVTVVLVGDGDAAGPLRRLADDLPGVQVVMPGRLPHAQALTWLAALDVVAVPRLDVDVCRLVSPLKPVEAMALGKPVVLSDLPALRELVDDGTDGLLVRPEDPVALADALQSLLPPDRRADLGTAAAERVRRGRTWAATTEAYLRVYEDVIR
ncbi:glycosyltransferase family 4 protein [Jannaschia sp. R86511]|uniref:glycosyltransferase family 4 protein n=1 Tax=Jannaschia sp. R86511 TaxID=3093853 RepID=UPI0036D2C785